VETTTLKVEPGPLDEIDIRDGDVAEFRDIPDVPPVADKALTVIAVVLPLAAIAAVAATWARTFGWGELIGAAVVFFVANLGINAGFHRLFTHHGFVPNRGLKLFLALAGCLSLQGSPTWWVATHRLHHARSDRPGDPHSPHAPSDPRGSMPGGRLRGLLHAHTGWLFDTLGADPQRWAPDMVADADQRAIDKWYPAIALGSLAAPFAVGLLVGGSVSRGLWALVWVSGVRVFFTYHATWSVNSMCHMFGRRVFETSDRSTNFAPLALISLGESWHNNHHAYPNLARHGLGRGQLDITAGMIRLFEKLGWATKVRWPSEKIRAAARTDR
jgi:stearoyl-CoA desaturase (Delta-9 desaturase)